MRKPINKVVENFNKAYYKGGKKELTAWTLGAKVSKRIISPKKYPGFYASVRRFMVKFANSFVWPNTFSASIDPVAVEVLYTLIRLHYPEIVVEVGTAWGYSGVAMAQALEDNNFGKLYTIDIDEQFLTRQVIKKAKLGHRIEYIIGDSANVLPKLNVSRVDLAFIDGSHDYEPVLKEFHALDKLLKSRGILVFHDSVLFLGVKKVIDIIRETGRYEVLTLDTLSGESTRQPFYNEPTNTSFYVFERKDLEGFTPVGLTICRKLRA